MTLFAKDIAQGMLVVSHNTLALVGFAVVAIGLVFSSQADLRHRLETEVLGWLNARQEARHEANGDVIALTAEPDAISRATAADPKELNRQQAAVTQWLARKYRVAPEPVARLVKEAWDVGQRARVEPTLILAIMAIESGFNPFAQSAVGAQGLMQVMTRVHDEKYQAFGGTLAAFDPVTNLRVGVQVLKECIQRAGGIEEGLRYYVGAANLNDDTGYAGRVLAEQDQLRAVASGGRAPARPAAPSAPAEPLREDRVALAH
ncbi:lytic transglycosylase domain-containing protein [Pelomonas sp. CA6]|nr:lytic transglycosylase domain-containing protein [Pelomonas sp. CA6]MCH7345577.1 lytic transglycosylase domain-containing protein [Pelomonas sp. CA6]